MGRVFVLLILMAAVCASEDAPVVPLTVCEVIRDLPAQEGKAVAVLGRYSYREKGRWIGEESCDPPVDVASKLWLVEDSNAPRPPGNFELDGAVLNRKFLDVRHRTALGKFRFGTPDYDRWAVIFGRVEGRKGEDAKKAPASLVFRGSGVVIILTPQ